LGSRERCRLAKHFIGDGGATYRERRRAAARRRSIRGHARRRGDAAQDPSAGHVAAVNAGVGSIMVSYNSWNGVKFGVHRLLPRF
jgi:hypothetical protein